MCFFPTNKIHLDPQNWIGPNFGGKKVLMNQCFYLKQIPKEKALRMDETSLQGGRQYGGTSVMRYLAIRQRRCSSLGVMTRWPLKGRQSLLLFLFRRTKTSGERFPQWMFSHENLVRASRRRKFRDSVAR